MARATFSTTFYCRSSKVNKQGLAPLELSIIVNQERLFLNLPSKLNPAEFNRKRKPNHIEDLLNTYRVRINEVCANLMSEGLPITSATLRDYLKTGGTKSKTVYNLCEDFKNNVSCSPSSIRKYDLVIDFLISFFGKDRELSTLHNIDIIKVYDKLKERFLISTAGAYMVKIKRIFTYAYDNNYIKNNLFNNIKISKGTSNITYLKEEDIEAIKCLKLEEYPRLEKVRDLMLFQLSVGLAYIDLITIDYTKIVNNEGVYMYSNRRQKTGVLFNAVILPMGIEILKKYNYSLPMISNQKYNAYLKEIQRLAKIKTNITSHLLRRSYATMLLNSGIRLETVSKCIGHSNPTLTAKCYAFLREDSIVSEFKTIFK